MNALPARTMVPLFVAGAMLMYMINLREAHFGEVMQLVSGWACVLMLLTIGRFPATRRNTWRLVFVLLAAYLTLRYLWWRSFETLIYTNPLDFIGMSALFAAEVYSITLHLLGLFVNLWPIDRDPVPMPADRVPEFLSGLSQAGDGDWERSIDRPKPTPGAQPDHADDVAEAELTVTAAEESALT